MDRIQEPVGLAQERISLVPGTILGLLSGYFGKRIDSIIMRCMDMLPAFPAILLAIFITAILEPSLTNTMIAVGIVYIPHYARIVRSSVLSLKGMLFVQAISHLGESHLRILLKHILPNCLPPIIVYATLGMGTAVLQLLPRPIARIAGGSILFKGQNLVTTPPQVIRDIRGNQISMIFQEPMTSLNPVYTVGFQIMEPLKKHRGMKKKAARQEAAGLLDLVGIPEPSSRLDDYPHQLSGGMRQRVMIAQSHQSAARLHFSSPVPHGGRDLQNRPAGTPGGGHRTPGSLPSHCIHPFQRIRKRRHCS